MTSFRQVAHIQMFSEFPLRVCVPVCMRACIAWHTLSWWPLCSPHNITTGAVYTIMTCTARGPATSVTPFLYFCPPPISWPLCISHTQPAHIYPVYAALFHLVFPLCLVCQRLSQSTPFRSSAFSALVHSTFTWEVKTARLTLQGLNACLTWHLSTMINKHIIQCQQAWGGSCSSSIERPRVQDNAQCRVWYDWVSQMSYGLTCAPPSRTQLITQSGQRGRGPRADQAFCPSNPPPLPRLCMESADLLLRQCGVRSITCDIWDIACIPDMHLHGVNLSVKPTHRQDIHISLHV